MRFCYHWLLRTTSVRRWSIATDSGGVNSTSAGRFDLIEIGGCRRLWLHSWRVSNVLARESIKCEVNVWTQTEGQPTNIKHLLRDYHVTTRRGLITTFMLPIHQPFLNPVDYTIPHVTDDYFEKYYLMCHLSETFWIFKVISSQINYHR